MKNILITLEYDGTNYHGWQKQKNAIAVQEIVENCINEVTGEKVNLIGAGRTDAGVHALGQKANFRTNSSIPVFKFPYALNSILPFDIRAVDALEVPLQFHARYYSTKKRYKYRIYNNPFPSAIYRNYCHFIPDILDVEGMKEGAAYLIGEKDFTSFCSSGSTVKTKIRRIYLLEIVKKGEIIDIAIEANGFLYNMVRIICGTLLEVGKGKIKPKDVIEILDRTDRKFAGPTLPAQGLFLEKVFYDLNS